MVDAQDTILTDRQVTVLKHRETGETQQEIADELGTTDSNVSAIERAAEANINKARRTLELVRTIRAPVRFSAPAGTDFEELVDTVYSSGDSAGIKIDYCRPELYSHLYALLEDATNQNQLESPVEIGLTETGDVNVYSELT